MRIVTNRSEKLRRVSLAAAAAIVSILAVGGPIASAHEEGGGGELDLVEKLGEQVPLDTTFRDENGSLVSLSAIVDRPTVLTLVYYRCPGICSPLLREVASVVDQTDLNPGTDYRLLTISFDPREGPEIAKRVHTELAGAMKKPAPAEAWAFLTGDAESIRKITEAVGFGYQFNPATEDFVHPTGLVFLSREGKITRTINGVDFLPADFKIAILDASAGRVRNFMQKLQRFCTTYDPVGRTYLLKINRVILLVTLTGVALFGLFLGIRGKRRRGPAGQSR